MIRVNQVVGRSRARTAGRIELERLGAAHLRVRNLERSVEFYRRIFGLKPIDVERQDAGLSRSVALPDGGRLVLHKQGSPAVELLPMADGFGVVVNDLDWAREAIWELGVPVASDSGEPDHIYRWPNGRSLYIRDPDGHEIELVETRATASNHRAGHPGDAAPPTRACRLSFGALYR